MNGTAAEMLDVALLSTCTSQKKLADKLGWSPQLLNSRLKKDTFPANEWLDAVRKLGYEIELRKGNGEEADQHRFYACPKFKKKVRGITYDRDRSTALCHDWFDIGIRELYRSEDGKHFLALQTCSLKRVLSIVPLDEVSAKKFYDDNREPGAPSFNQPQDD